MLYPGNRSETGGLDEAILLATLQLGADSHEQQRAVALLCRSLDPSAGRSRPCILLEPTAEQLRPRRDRHTATLASAEACIWRPRRRARYQRGPHRCCGASCPCRCLGQRRNHVLLSAFRGGFHQQRTNQRYLTGAHRVATQMQAVPLAGLAGQAAAQLHLPMHYAPASPRGSSVPQRLRR